MAKKGFENQELAKCSFCGRTEEDVQKLISGPDAYICDNCVRLCMSILEKKATPESAPREIKVLKPQEIKNHLDEYIIGQDQAKRTISVAVYNHYKRVRSLTNLKEVGYSKSNVMLLGPT